METIPAAQAVEALIHAYGTLVFQTIYGFTGDWHESQDLTQETFLQALRAIDAARASSGAHFHAKAWLFRIATNLVLMQRRRQARVRVLPFSSLQEEGQDEAEVDCPCAHTAPVQPAGYATAPTGDPADLVAERDAIRRTMGLLPEPLRLCLLLSVVGGFSAPQMGSLQRAQSLLHRGSRWSRTKSWCRPGCPIWSSPALDLHSGGARQMVLRLSQCGTTHNKTTEH